MKLKQLNSIIQFFPKQRKFCITYTEENNKIITEWFDSVKYADERHKQLSEMLEIKK
jgi:hypothetical protein